VCGVIGWEVSMRDQRIQKAVLGDGLGYLLFGVRCWAPVVPIVAHSIEYPSYNKYIIGMYSTTNYNMNNIYITECLYKV
jgi:hypothetical protein